MLVNFNAILLGVEDKVSKAGKKYRVYSFPDGTGTLRCLGDDVFSPSAPILKEYVVAAEMKQGVYDNKPFVNFKLKALELAKQS